ncbi:hypothetical protein [Aeromicrobium sp. NPDC092404]|uniref:hypothetical protein n=1 Tax=Aeromicrobium sp. NPDC092404 TaxID=3154976 RepID=UPI0034423112
MSERPSRPQRLARACVYLGVIGAVQLIQAMTDMIGWYSDGGQTKVEQFTDPLVKEGLARGDAETVYRVYLAIVAVVAASVLVFAIYTAMGQAVSRVMLTIVAPVMVVLGLGLGSFLATLLCAVALFFVFQLWHPEVNRWFARLAGKEPPVPVAAGAAPPAPSLPPQHPGPDPSTQPAAPPSWQPGPQPYARPHQPPADAVKILSILTLVISSVIALGCGFYLLVYGFAREALVEEMLRSDSNWMDLGEAEIRDSIQDLAVISWVMLPLCLVATVVATVLLVRCRRR